MIDHARNAFRERSEWIEDTITAALCARLPVSHVVERHDPMLLESNPVLFDDSVILVGGHVFGRRVVRLTSRPPSIGSRGR